jgi:L-lactate dehydrogenase (cytochrome)
VQAQTEAIAKKKSMPRRSPRLRRCHSIADLRAVARRRLPHPIFQYLDGAAEDEITAARNVSAFDTDSLVPRALVDVQEVDTATTVLGQRIDWPVICSPTGSSRFYHADGELAVARAAAEASIIYSLATMSSYSIEAVAAASTGPKMFQLFVFKDRGITREHIARSKAAGYNAICLTVDVAVRGKRERELRSGMGIPTNFTLAALASFALRPAWLLGLARKGRFSMPTFNERVGGNIVDQTRFLGEQLDPSLEWGDIAEFIRLWDGPFAIKGLLSAADARRAADLGASAVMVSNHGGRQLDHAAAPYDVLPEIADAVGDRMEIILDGGVRRGVHVLKALARGATACSVGRSYLYGLGAGGYPGVVTALEILRTEFVRAMQLTGCPDVGAIDGTLLREF